MAKIEAVFVCDEVKQDSKTGRLTAVGIWQQEKLKLPHTAPLTVVVLVSGADFRPETISVSVIDPATNEVFTRSVQEAQQPPDGQKLLCWITTTPTLEFNRPGRVAVKVDADGVSPASYEFELVRA